MEQILRAGLPESPSAAVRRQRIIEELHQQDEVSVTGLSERMRVSDVTIRKDLQQLEYQGYLTRVRGGAVFSGRGQLELRFAARQQICLDEKRRIAMRAVEYVRPGSTIFLDGSSTVFQMTRLLRDMRGLTVVTNELYAALELSFAVDVTTIVVGDIQNIVQSLKQKGIGILITDHNVRETLNICDRAYILENGKMLEEGTPMAISRSEKARRIYLGEQFTL